MNKHRRRPTKGLHEPRVFLCKPNMLVASIRASLRIYTPALVSYDCQRWFHV
jgi:hypothetical protein